MRHTLKESILQGPVHFYVGLGRSYLCHLCALLSVLKARLFDVTITSRLGAGDYAEAPGPAFQKLPSVCR